MAIDLQKIENLGIDKVIKRGTAEILEQDEDGIFVYDTVSDMFMISCEETEKAKAWILNHTDRCYSQFAVIGKAITDYVLSLYSYENVLECRQIAYLKKDLDLVSCDAVIRNAVRGDLGFLTDHYFSLSEEELSRLIDMGNILIAEVDGKPAGFAGEHLEGCLGLLFVLPEYRRQGIAYCLEQRKMKDMMDAGYIPFGQVVVGNEKSMNLQKKLGMEEGGEFVYLLF